MRERLLDLVHRLRARGVEISPAETADAVRAVAAAGVEREVLREALAATLVKDEADRAVFDALFEETFPLRGADDGEGRRARRRRAGGGPAADGRGAAGTAGGRPRPGAEAATPREGEGARAGGARRGAGVPAAGREGEGRAARRRRLLALPFAEFTARDVAEARDLVRELGRRLRGRLARRLRRARRGPVDFRRTIRASLATGGTPLRPAMRARRPGRPDLVALCDLSGSVAAASELLLGLVAPAAGYFRRVGLFAYVDRLCPVSIEDGHVAPEGRLDLHARSDFGRVLDDLWRGHRDLLGRGTLLLVLGDARNNRLPPRVDLWRAVRERVKTVVWLVPEPRGRWNTGDSVLGLYAPACDAVVECLDLGTLVRAVRRALG
ncbi:MAG TPA: VWA domain-containing protein [Candidatus Binatia bacterium]|nr:VWA domain-containing protein [Candidatus Binatia bacterium]